MRMKVQGRLMQARFIEIHQVFVNKVGYFPNGVVPLLQHAGCGEGNVSSEMLVRERAA